MLLLGSLFSFSRAISAHKPKMKQRLIPDELNIEVCAGTNTLMAPVQGCALFTNQFELQGDASVPSVVYSSPCSHSTITLRLGYLQLQFGFCNPKPATALRTHFRTSCFVSMPFLTLTSSQNVEGGGVF